MLKISDMSKKLLPHKNKEVIEKLKKNGFSIKQSRMHKNSRHFFFWKKMADGKEFSALVSKNPSKIAPIGTLNSIIRNSGKPREEFCKRKI